MNNAYLDLLSERGVSLSELGIHGRALGRADAFEAIEILRGQSVPILGGDVYFDDHGRIELAYCNWYADPVEGESINSFAERSCEHTRRYIESFPKNSDKTPIFGLVTASQ